MKSIIGKRFLPFFEQSNIDSFHVLYHYLQYRNVIIDTKRLLFQKFNDLGTLEFQFWLLPKLLFSKRF
jgi:hypothetical protein